MQAGRNQAIATIDGKHGILVNVDSMVPTLESIPANVSISVPRLNEMDSTVNTMVLMLE
jgi:hypothetical protein